MMNWLKYLVLIIDERIIGLESLIHLKNLRSLEDIGMVEGWWTSGFFECSIKINSSKNWKCEIDSNLRKKKL